ncbi:MULTISPECIES: acetate kinase [Cyanophyceae]|uniref:acetate kinase n=1 Tax=Cyanophyceae TaxID=3028117 RepID=UPI0016864A2B|nr:acetate kinase [Trichocoleus sp. FACHB-69]MBD1933246.1 acetate kinase [Trichocoleus sp. FACHB-69]
MKILVLNAGSSTQKSCLYELGDSLPQEPLTPLWEAQIDWTKQPGMALIEVKTRGGAVFENKLPLDDRLKAIASMLETLWCGDTQVVEKPTDIDIVGHRVVHGGEEYRLPTLITAEVKDAIARLAEYAPIHNPVNLEGIEAIEQILGNSVPQVAVFDTAFHSQLPPAAYVYPGLYEWLEQGIRRYGFHGISHQYCAQRAAQILGRNLDSLRLITCHLGNGCSLAAILNGYSIDTTMGFTPLEGLMMGSRSGSVDPGILIHLLRQSGMDAEKLDKMLNSLSGLKGISGLSGDMRHILSAIAQENPRATLAFDIYVHSLRKHIGAMLASLGGLDALVFTGGVGENAAAVREQACAAFEFLGLQLDPQENAASPRDRDIATFESKIRVLIVHAQEDWAIAVSCWQLGFSAASATG